MLGRLLCRLGFHRWVTVVSPGGERFLECRRCRAYGGETPGAWKYRD